MSLSQQVLTYRDPLSLCFCRCHWGFMSLTSWCWLFGSMSVCLEVLRFKVPMSFIIWWSFTKKNHVTLSQQKLLCWTDRQLANEWNKHQTRYNNQIWIPQSSRYVVLNTSTSICTKTLKLGLYFCTKLQWKVSWVESLDLTHLYLPVTGVWPAEEVMTNYCFQHLENFR